jgi:hypothetical protein
MLVCAGGLLLAMRWFTGSTPGALTAAKLPPVPDRRLRFVTCDVQARRLQSEPVLAEIAKCAPDFLILQNTREADVRAVAEAMHLQFAFAASTHGRGRENEEPQGNAILAKAAILSLPPGGPLGLCVSSSIGPTTVLIAALPSPGSSGAWAVAPLVAQWKDLGSPPIVLAGAFPGTLEADNLVENETGWFDALSAWPAVVRGTSAAKLQPRIFLSAGWSCTGGGLISGYAITPAWIDAGSSAFATTPTAKASTQPSTQADD